MPNNSSCSSVFIPQSQENEYCRKHNLLLWRLAYNLTIVGAARNTSDSVHSSVNFSFPFPSPPVTPQQFTTYHLVEHLLNPPIRELLLRNNVSVKAASNYFHLLEIADGNLPHQKTAYSLWGAIGLLLKRFHELSTLKKINPQLADTIKSEAVAVKSEILENKAKHNYAVVQELAHSLLAKENPQRNFFCENENIVDQISPQEILHAVKEIFNQTGLTISVFTDGSLITLEKFLNEIRANLHLPPSSSGKDCPPKLAMADLINPDRQNSYQQINLGKNTSLVSVCAVWIAEVPPFTPADRALILAPFLSTKAMNLGRVWQLGYSANFTVQTLHRYKILQVTLTMPKQLLPDFRNPRQKMHEFICQLMTNNNQNFQEILKTKIAEEKFVPITTSSYLNWAVKGITEYGQIINPEALRQITISLTLKNFTDWMDYFLSTPPAIFLIGDLS